MAANWGNEAAVRAQELVHLVQRFDWAMERGVSGSVASASGSKSPRSLALAFASAPRKRSLFSSEAVRQSRCAIDASGWQVARTIPQAPRQPDRSRVMALSAGAEQRSNNADLPRDRQSG